LGHEARIALLDPKAEISLTRQAQLFDISRSSIYYKKHINQDDIAAMRAIDIEFTKYPFYGSRRMKVALEHDHDISICREHVIHLMRLMGLEALYPKENTSRPDHLHRVYPYLLSKLAAAYPDHIWGTDITYIRLKDGFCYLVAIIDWYSRSVVHWELSPTLEIPFCLDNITRALQSGRPDIHNSDQGSHFTSPQYTGILTAHGIEISMDGRGRCMDNIFTERLWRSLKYECVYLNEFGTIAEAHRAIEAYFIFYNTVRPHQSLDYQTPATVYLPSKNMASRMPQETLQKEMMIGASLNSTTAVDCGTVM
jgi:putative transposase